MAAKAKIEGEGKLQVCWEKEDKDVNEDEDEDEKKRRPDEEYNGKRAATLKSCKTPTAGFRLDEVGRREW